MLYIIKGTIVWLIICRWEIDYAINNGCFLNIDSLFDAVRISTAAKCLQIETNVLIRVNPSLGTKVHPYNSTALSDSKFGVELAQMDKVSANQYWFTIKD